MTTGFRTLTGVLWPRDAVVHMVRQTSRTFDALLARSGWKALAFMVLSIFILWHIYVPVHELLHVAACILTGGTAETLHLQPRYGANLLKHVFPLVVPATDYAGRLTSFSVPNDAAYALVDIFPYLPSLPGFALIVCAGRRQSAPLFGAGLLLAYAPVLGVTGDWYEACSLMTTRIATWIDPSLPDRILVSDDVFRSVSELRAAGALNAWTWMLVIGGQLLAVYLVLVMLAAQVALTHARFPPAAASPNQDSRGRS